MWLLFRHRLYRPGQKYLLVGDETVVTKSGHKTHGIDRFFFFALCASGARA